MNATISVVQDIAFTHACPLPNPPPLRKGGDRTVEITYFSPLASRLTPHASRLTPLASRLASRLTPLASRFTLHNIVLAQSSRPPSLNQSNGPQRQNDHRE